MNENNLHALSQAQRDMLANLARVGGTAETIMQLRNMERYRIKTKHNGRGHSASYARFHRLRRRGLVTIVNGHPSLTPAGRRVIERKASTPPRTSQEDGAFAV